MRARKLLAAAVTAAALTPATGLAAAPLVGQWSLDNSYEDGSSDFTADASGNGLALRAPLGSVHLGSPALFGTGATLGTNTTPLQITSPLLAPANVTLLAWVKQSGFPGTLRYLAGRGDDGLTCGGSTYALYTGYPAKPGLRFYVRTGSGLSALTDAPPDASVFNGQWHLVAGTYDGTAARLYVDGNLVGAPIPAPPPLTYNLGGGSTFYVDGYAVEGCALFFNADDWTGAIDEVRVYDTALSASELGRLAAATGPNAPDLVTDASLVPATVPVPPLVQQPGPVEPAAKALQRAAMAQAVDSVPGAAKQAASKATQAALADVEAQALAAMKSAATGSKVSAAEKAEQMTASQAKAAKPDPRIQARLDAMQYGLEASVPTGAPGQIVEAVATIALLRKSGGIATTQTVQLPPAVGQVPAGASKAPVTFTVDQQAAKAMGKRDIAGAAISIQAIVVDDTSDIGELRSQQLQQALDRLTKSQATIDNVLKKIADTQQQITQNMRGGLTPSEKKEQQTLNRQMDKLEKQAEQAETASRQANQQASDALREAAAAAAAAQGSLPAATAGLAGCKACQLAAG